MIPCFGQRGYNCLDSLQKAKILTWKNERDQFARLLEIKDTILFKREQQLTLLGLEAESFRVSLDLAEKMNKSYIEVIKSLESQKNSLLEDKAKLEKKLGRQRRLKWVFGGIGFIGGVLVMIS